MTSCEPLLFLDFETFSAADIKATGAYRYIEDETFEPLLMAFAYDEDEVSLLPFAEGLTEHQQAELKVIQRSLTDPSVLKVAHNCAFERAVIRRSWGIYSPPEQWCDTMCLAAMNGLPASLDAAGEALHLELLKEKEGTSLINYFSKPCRPTGANGGRTRNLPQHSPERWERFGHYCARDVEVCREIYHRLCGLPITPAERTIFAVDARINERGVLVDTELAEAAVAVDEAARAAAEAEMQRLTGLDNPNSLQQLKGWLASRGVEAEALRKADVADLVDTVTSPTVKRVLQLRQLLGKTSTKKYQAMLSAACKDGRVRGLTQYYGAGRTGRWAGRLVQLQNLPQNHLDNIERVRELVRQRDTEALELIYDSVPDTLSQLIRTAFIPAEGRTYLVADYSAIEARVIAYLAGEQWRMDTFAQGGDIYCASASKMFGAPVEKHGVNGHLRQKGKIAELALGYGGGVNALVAFGADKMGLTAPEMEEIVSQWRQASPTIPRLWRAVEQAAIGAIEQAAIGAIEDGGRHHEVLMGGTRRTAAVYRRDQDALRCVLPSGRVLSYWAPEIDDEGRISFMAVNQTTRQWQRTSTWGGRLVENIVQAFARDCLGWALARLEQAGFEVVFHVHDEVIVEAPKGRTWQEVAEIMGKPLPWAPGLLLRAEGYETEFYRKD